MNTISGVPPGFRFSPTDEELVDYYLRRKVSCRSRIDNLHVIKDIDLYKIEPWDLQELCKIGTGEQSEWYFFSHRDKKYPTGMRTNRATAAGFWKATGRDKAIYSNGDLIGMRKTLVFYKGRAPNGQKSDWIMHEYRLQTDDEHGSTHQEEGWVVCRVFTKPLAKNIRKVSDDHDSPIWYEDPHHLQHQLSPQPELDSPKQISHPSNLTTTHHHHHPYPLYKEPDHSQYYSISHGHLFKLPFLDSPKLLQVTAPTIDGRILINRGSCTLQSSLPSAQQEEQIGQQVNEQQKLNSIYGDNYQSEPAVRDWRVLDKLVASQLSGQEEMAPQNGSASTPTCQTALWK